MRLTTKLAAALLAALLQACVTPPLQAPTAPLSAAEAPAPVTILVSIDGFRPDYLDRGVTPELNALAASGVRAPMRPSFPTKTFPNHQTLLTGMRPDHHGIVGHKMEDARAPGAMFSKASLEPIWWDGAEPLWASAEEAGIRTGAIAWPGANADMPGPSARDVRVYAEDFSVEARIDTALDWMRRPPALRPQLLFVYLDLVDDVAHDDGVEAPTTTAAVARADALIGRLRAGLEAIGQPANLVIVSDHGGADVSRDRTIPLATLADPADYRAIEDGPYASLEPVPGHQAALETRLLARHDHVRCWRKAAIPAKFRFGHNPHVPRYFCLADTRWLISALDPPLDWLVTGADHGWDNDAPEMRALFIGHGPAFASGRRLKLAENVDVVPLLRHLVGLPRDRRLDGGEHLAREALVRR